MLLKKKKKTQAANSMFSINLSLEEKTKLMGMCIHLYEYIRRSKTHTQQTNNSFIREVELGGEKSG